MPGRNVGNKISSAKVTTLKTPITSKRVESLLNTRNTIKDKLSIVTKKEITSLLAKGDRRKLSSYLVDLIKLEQILEKHVETISATQTPHPENVSFIKFLQKESSSLKSQLKTKKEFLSKLLEADFENYKKTGK
jgi:hypothetical protein